MTDKSDSTTEQQEETVNLFSDGFDDKSLVAPAEGAGDGEQKQEQKEVTAEADDTVPDKYKGKSLVDVIQMHQEVEKAYGRGQNELGELRQLTDTILKQQLGETTAARKKLEADTLLEDPDSAINGAVADNPKIKELEAKLTARERADNLAAFNRKHPKAGEIVNDPRFIKWVGESPTRSKLVAQADQTFDYELASEIITMFEQTHLEQGESKEEGKQALSNAKPSKGSATGGKRVIFKRSELMRLKMENPDRYEKLQPQIMAAYAEGRVR